MYEYEIEAMVAYQFRLHHGVEAFPTIVASGPNSCILHYTQNTRKIETGDLILLDFGIELGGYGADISRTFCVSDTSFAKEVPTKEVEDLVSHFSNPRQQLIYDAVLDVSKYAESTLRPGITRKEWNTGVRQYMYEVCVSLHLEDIESHTPVTNPYFPHSIGHYLGLDTHDVGDSDIPLAPGMLLTIEPGIYIPAETIGIRIEDDYLLTESGCERLR
jgi:Xaa-Pro aminopeptidase